MAAQLEVTPHDNAHCPDIPHATYRITCEHGGAQWILRENPDCPTSRKAISLIVKLVLIDRKKALDCTCDAEIEERYVLKEAGQLLFSQQGYPSTLSVLSSLD